MTDRRGGRVPPDGRPPQFKGVGKNAKRHDLERPATPGLHGSDLQQGDVRKLEWGQRIAPTRTQEPGRTPEIATQARVRGEGVETSSMQLPDAIDFLGERNGSEFGPPGNLPDTPGGKLSSWQPILERLISGPGSSGGLANLYIKQMRRARQETFMRPAVQISLDDIDAGIQGMVDELEAE